MTLEEALAKIAELEAAMTTLETDKTALEAQIQRVSKNKGELLHEKKKYQQFERSLSERGYALDDLDGLLENLDTLVEPKEGDTGKKSTQGKGLVEALRQQKQEFERQLADAEARLTGEKLERLTLAELGKHKDILSPNQMQMLLRNQLKLNDIGQLVVSVNDVEVDLGKHLDSLRKDSAWQNQFAAQTKPGMGSDNNASGGSGGTQKAWKDMSLTERSQAADKNPEAVKTELESAGLGLFAP
jgi:chromosome segregation ATPase